MAVVPVFANGETPDERAARIEARRFLAEPAPPSCFAPLAHLSGESAGDRQAAPRASFTPGPWKCVSKNAARDFNQISVRPASPAIRGMVLPIAYVVRYGDWSGCDGVANARLIAAAPTLYAELKHASELLTLAAFHHRTVDFEGDRFDLLAEAERFDALIEGVRG